MRVGFDLDGVVYNWHGSLREYVMRQTGQPASDFPDPEEWNFYEKWGLTLEQFIDYCNRGVDDGIIFQWGEPLPGAVESWQRIKDAGHTIHVVTDRRAGDPGAAHLGTVSWLHEYGLPFDSLTFSSDKSVVKTHVMVDDKLENYDTLTFAGTRAYLINRPWNQQEHEYPWRRRVDSLEQFTDEILALARPSVVVP